MKDKILFWIFYARKIAILVILLHLGSNTQQKVHLLKNYRNLNSSQQTDYYTVQ